MVAGAGNEVGYHHHFMGSMSPEQEFEDIELRVGADETGFCMELWAREPELYTIGVVSPSGEVIDRLSLNLNAETVISFRLDSTVLTVSYQNYESDSGSQLIFMRFRPPLPGSGGFGCILLYLFPDASMYGFPCMAFCLTKQSFSALTRAPLSWIPEMPTCPLR